MSYDPKWIRDDAVVKRDGTNDLTGDWDIGNQRKIILDELQMRDASGLTISDTTANILVSIDNQTGLFSLRNGTGINEFSTDTTLAGDSDNAVPTVKAIKTYVDTSIAGFSTTPDTLYYDSTATRVVATIDGATVSAGGVQFLDLSANFIRVGVTGDTYLDVNPLGNQIEGVLNATSYFLLDANEQRLGVISDTSIRVNQSTNVIALRGGNTLGAEFGNFGIKAYYTGNEVFRTQSNGILVLDSANAGVTMGYSGSTFNIQGTEAGGDLKIRAKQTGSTDVDMATLDPDGVVELYYNGLKSFQTTALGVDVFDTDGNQAFIYFKRSNGATAGNVNFADGNFSIYDAINTNNIIYSSGGAGVNLYYNGTIALQTNIEGISVRDTSGAAPVVYFKDDANVSLGRIYATTEGLVSQVYNGATWETAISCVLNGSVQLHHDGTRVFNTTADGIAIKDASGDEPVLYFRDDADAEMFRIAGYTASINIESHDGTNWNPISLFSDAGIQLANGVAVDEISNDTTASLSTQLMTAEAIQARIGETYGSYIHTQDSTSTTWVVTHNLGYQYVNVEVANADDEVIIPDSITFDTTLQLTITFANAESGHAAVTSGGGEVGPQGPQGPASIAGAYIHTQDSTSTTWVVTHNLGYQYVNVEVVDADDKAIIPDEITFNTINQLTITFLSAESGYAAVTSGGGQVGATNQIFSNDTSVNVVDDGTATSYIEMVVDGVQVAYWDAEATTIRLGKATSAGKVEINDTNVSLYYNGVAALDTQTQGIIVRDTSGNTAAIEMRNYLGTLQGRIIGGTTSNTWQIGSSNEDAIKVNNNGAVQFYYNDGLKFETSAEGIKAIYTAPGGFVFSDQLGNDAITIHQGNAIDLAYGGGKVLSTRNDGIVLHSIDETEEAQLYVSSATDYLILTASATSGGIKLIGTDSGDAAADMIICNPNGDVDLYHDGVNTFETSQFGANCIHASTPSLGLWEGDESGVVGWCWANSTDIYVQHDLTDGAVILSSKASTNTRLLTWDPANGGLYPTIENAYTCGTAANVWSDIYAQSGSVNTSDEREKTEITESALGLDFIDALNPVSYKFKDYDWVDSQTQRDGTVVDSTGTHTFVRTHYGLISQQVKQTMDSLGIDSTAFAGYIYNPESDYYGLRYHEFIAPMIKAIQELKATNEAQQTQIDDLISRVEALEGA